jgi:hypothetical protein
MKLVGAGPGDITVTFAPNLNGGLAGSTSQERDTNGVIDKADVVLSEQTPKTLLHEALLHELGHAVGLGHAPRPGEVMDPSSPAKPTTRPETSLAYAPSDPRGTTPTPRRPGQDRSWRRSSTLVVDASASRPLMFVVVI